MHAIFDALDAVPPSAFLAAAGAILLAVGLADHFVVRRVSR